MIRPKQHLEHIHRTPSVMESRIESLRLDKNEFLPHWPEDWFRDAMSGIRPEHLSIHPETGVLYEKLEKILGVPKQNMVVTAGSDAAIKAAFEVFVEPGDEVVIPSPTFAMYYVYAQVYNAKLVEVHYDAKLALSADAMIGAITPRVKLVAIANPNSPTGTVFGSDDLRRIITHASRMGAAVLIDEAYFPFYEQSMLGEIGTFDNLIVTRTFSKAAGLAGMRTGVFISNPAIARLAFAVKPMYEITTISAMLAEHVLDHYQRIYDYAAAVREGRQYLADYLSGHEFDVYQGHANFLHVDLGPEKTAVVKFLSAHDVQFKGSFDHQALRRYSRFTVGPIEYMRKLVELFEQYYQGQQAVNG